MTEGIARRTPAPRREDYAVVDGSRGPRRDFRITVGLREGWEKPRGGSTTFPRRYARRGPG